MFVWLVLGVNILVILWGALVRATGSGAGCGSHWPSCQGQLIPLNPAIETIIEFTHRLSSGLAFILVVLIVVFAFQRFPKGNSVRKGAVFSLIFITLEALLGAGLVLFELVAKNDSLARAIAIALHLANTFLLLGSITLTGWWASGGSVLSFRTQKKMLVLFFIGFGGILILGMSGAITALGDTLFPANNLMEGFQADVSAASHFLIRLRVFHPFIAFGVGIYLLVTAMIVILNQPNDWVKRFSVGLLILFFFQLIAGMINLLLLAPVYMQLIHLFLADCVWITFVLLSAATFSRDPELMLVPEAQESAQGVPVQPSSMKATNP